MLFMNVMLCGVITLKLNTAFGFCICSHGMHLVVLFTL